MCGMDDLVRLARSVGIDAGGGREKTGEAERALVQTSQSLVINK